MDPKIIRSILCLVISALVACSGPQTTAPPAAQSGLVETIVAGTLQAVLSTTPIPSVTTIAAIAPAIPAGWVLFKSDEYGLEFAHPALYDCKDQCGMSAFTNLGDIRHIATLAVQSTMSHNGNDSPFDAVSFDVFQNPKALSLQDFVEQEKQAILSGPMPIGAPVSEIPISIAGQTSIKMNFDGNIFSAIYVPFPTSHQILIVSISNATGGSFDATADQILATLHFIQ